MDNLEEFRDGEIKWPYEDERPPMAYEGLSNITRGSEAWVDKNFPPVSESTIYD